MFEILESRTLRSSSLNGDTLLINGTSAADTIVLTNVNTKDVQVTVNGVNEGTFHFAGGGGPGDESNIEIHGLGGNDTITLDQAIKWDTFIYGEAGSDTINGGGGTDVIDAGAGNDSVIGNNGDDRFVNPAYIGRYLTDQDHYWGGFGQDFMSYQGRSAAVVVTLDGVANDGTATGVVGAASNEKDNVHTDVEGILGTDSADYLVGNLFNNNISGNGGADTVYGQSGHDTLNGGEGNDTIYGGEANDWIFGYGGSDSIDGGSGNDSIRGGMSGDTMAGGTGTDTIEYENHVAAVVASLDGVQNDGYAGENDWIKSDCENLTGTQYDDSLTGSSGANLLDGKNGNDSMYGLAGNDTMVGGFGADLFDGGSDTDTADYTYAIGALNITIDGVNNDGIANEHDNVRTNVENVIGGQHNDFISGSAFSNVLIGNGGNDTLQGLGGNDQLFGNAGDDSLVGGAGTDTLDGGAGVNVLVQ